MPHAPKRFLFVGNSFTFWNDGLATHFERLARSANPPVTVETASVVKGGASLKVLWEIESPNVRQAIRDGGFEVVVLQEDLPETDVESFHEHARRFCALVRASGATPVLFMAWPYERLGWISGEEIARAHRAIGDELEVAVAPVWPAWQRAASERPELDLYHADREHPSLAGTYLAVNVVYATVFGRSPVGLAYVPEGVAPADAALLQRIAAEVAPA